MSPATPNDTEEKLLVENKYSSQDDATKSSAEESQVSEEFDIRMIKYLVTPVNNLIKTSILLYIWAALMLLYYGTIYFIINYIKYI